MPGESPGGTLPRVPDDERQAGPRGLAFGLLFAGILWAAIIGVVLFVWRA